MLIHQLKALCHQHCSSRWHLAGSVCPTTISADDIWLALFPLHYPSRRHLAGTVPQPPSQQTTSGQHCSPSTS